MGIKYDEISNQFSTIDTSLMKKLLVRLELRRYQILLE